MIKSSSLFFTVLILILKTDITCAQILNVEKFQNDIEDAKKLFGQINLSGSITHVQKTIYDLKQQSTISYSDSLNRYLLIGQTRWINADNQTLLSNGYAHLRYTRTIETFLAIELFFQEQFDAVRHLKRRDLLGLDFRFNIIENKRTHLLLSTGFMYEYEWWDDNIQSVQNPFLKSTNSLRLAINASKNVLFHSTGYLQIQPNQTRQIRLILDSSLTWKLNKRLRFSLTNNIFYDSKPVISIDPFVNETNFSIGFNF